MLSRPGDATADLAGITDLVQRYEAHWFGAPEQDADEVAETMGRVTDWARDVRVVEAGRLDAAAWRWQEDLDLVVAPSVAEATEIVDELLDWLAAGSSGQLQVLDRDQRVLAAAVARGWRHTRSAFELRRAIADGWPPAPPHWPAGVGLVDYRPDDARAVHRLVYDDAGWSEVLGHQHRDFDEWHSLFLAEHTNPLLPVVAWRGSRPVGAALTRTFTDGTGWINQLAVARDERGRGLGAALLRECIARLRARGVARVALGVQAGNAGALGLYLRAGLHLEREYRYYAPPPGG